MEEQSSQCWIRNQTDACRFAIMELVDLRNLKIAKWEEDPDSIKEDPDPIDIIDNEIEELTKELNSGMENHYDCMSSLENHYACYVCAQVGMGIIISEEEISVKLKWNGTKFQLYGEQVDPY